LTIRIGPAGAVADQAARFRLLSVRKDRRQGMARRQHDQLNALNKEQRIGTDDQRTDTLRSHGREGIIDLASGTGVENAERLSDCDSSSLHGHSFGDTRWIVWINEQSDHCARERKLTRKLQPFGYHRCSVEAHTRDIALRTIQVVDDARSDGITANCEHDRNRRGRRLGCQRSRCAANRGEYRDPTLDQLVRQCRQLLVLAACPAVLNREGAALDEARLAEALVKGRHDEIRIRPRQAAEQPNDRNV
jgi:hypothetical protein